jgi:C-terminal processing protease CtpA/Prc
MGNRNFSVPSLFAHTAVLVAALGLIVICGIAQTARAQTVSSYERESGREMLRMIKSDINKNYYDSKFRGIDLEARFKAADEKVKQATSNGQIFGIIAQVLLDFDDSHLFFIPPPRAASIEYGLQMQMIGERCFVSAVKPGSDAEAKGLKPGDQILSVDGFEPSRETMWKMQYYYYTLRPKPALRFVAQSPDEQPRQLDIAAKIKQGARQIDLTSNWQAVKYFLEAESEARLNRHRFAEVGKDLVIWKMPGFDTYEDKDIDALMNKVRNHKAVILDLRGNGGGFVVMLERLLGHFIDHDVKIADLKGRKEMKPSIAKTRGGDAFKGQLVVLVDSRSGSAAELFARVIQLEKRGVVLGDRSSGAVMQSLRYQHEVGLETVVPYAASVTNADLIMADGKSLEHTGVIPDELVLPTGADMAAQRDPVLTRAAELLGFKIEPEKAGALFPIEWKK